MKNTERRNFIKMMGLASMASASNSLLANVELSMSSEQSQMTHKMAVRHLSDPLVGIQISPHSILDEGVEYCLDLLREKGQINTLFMNVNSYYGGMGKDLNVLGDHGRPKVDNSKRSLPLMWLNHDDSFFTKTSLRYPRRNPDRTFGKRDILHELPEPLLQRGMNLYLRFYEGWGEARGKTIPGWSEKCTSIDMYGNRHELPCWNKPDLKEFWKATFADVCTNYQISGIQFGAERSGSLRQVLYGLAPATCFCSDCAARAARMNVDLGRAREGNIVLHEFIQDMKSNKSIPPEGVLSKLFRIIFNYPEVLQWDKEDRRAREEFYQACYDKVKSINKDIQFGIHITDTQARCPIENAQTQYGRMQSFADFIKIIAYHDIGGVRMARNVGRLQDGILRDLEIQTILDIILQSLRMDKRTGLTSQKISTDGLPPAAYVHRIVERSVAQIDDDTHIYAGIGFDIPKGKDWNGEKFPSTPREIREAVYAAVNAGAKGIVASREYEEMEGENIEAFGRAIIEISRT